MQTTHLSFVSNKDDPTSAATFRLKKPAISESVSIYAGRNLDHLIAELCKKQISLSETDNPETIQFDILQVANSKNYKIVTASGHEILINKQFAKALCGLTKKKPLIASFGLHACSTGSASPSGAKLLGTILPWLKISIIFICLAVVVIIILGHPLCALAFFLIASSLYLTGMITAYKKVSEISGVIVNPNEQFNLEPRTGICDAFPTENSADTEYWRNQLIVAAEENIVISGNYCGGKSFIKMLQLIDQQMEKKDKLKVVIISSPKFLTPQIRKIISELRQKYPTRFSLVESRDALHISPGVKQITNHTKCTVIDYGKYFILGGSGIKDNFAETGLRDTPKSDYLQSRYDLQEDPESDVVCDTGLVAYFVPGQFRDMDFVFKTAGSKNISGSQVHTQMLLLAYRWEQYNQIMDGEIDSFTPLNFQTLGAFNGIPSLLSNEDSVTLQLLKTPIPAFEEIKTSVAQFDQKQDQAKKISFKVYASGPEQSKSVFGQELMKKIEKATKKIVINHMYFHPTQAIFDALVEAANRGVQIEIITCGIYPGCPNSHFAFGPRNKYNYSKLWHAIAEEHRKNLRVFEFNEVKIGNHKKVIIIDDTVIAGSSNLGYKSLVSTSDHELNFFAKSQKFADQTQAVCDVDKAHSSEINSFNRFDYFRAAMHRLLAPMIG